MRITFLLPGYPWGPVGGFRVVYEYANHLSARGHSVSVVHPMRPWNSGLAPGASPRRRLWHRAGLIRERILRPSLRWQTIDHKVRMLYVPSLASRDVPDGDAVFATAWNTAEYVNQYPHSKGEKFYLIQHYEVWAGPKERVDATWRMPLHKVTISGWLHDLACQMGCRDITTIPNGFDHARLGVATPIATRPKRAAMMFSHTEWKGSADGLAALLKARERHPDLQAVLFGVSRRPGVLPPWIEYWRDPPQRQLVEEIYNSARIFACPSWTEGFPLPPAEAMACGCALASTNCTGISEYAEHEVTALLSPVRDPEALANNIIRLLDDNDLCIKLAKEGHKRIQIFTWERSTDLLENFIRARVGGTRCAAGEVPAPVAPNGKGELAS